MRPASLAALAATLILAAIVTVLTLGPSLVPGKALGGDKVQHALGFGAIILPIALVRPRWLIVAAPAVIAGGGLIEILQDHVGRDGDLADWVSDIAGVGAMILLALALRRIARIAVPSGHRFRRARPDL
ncbi:hypothetical protein [Oceanicola sp. S124]|uniref:hypothetical protein n=1 Tax=Oceanicola sp. S124 TaxID=1042378 RepID=UPI00025599B8|nr:hypothetical protein [Oceanicola sp. S124]